MGGEVSIELGLDEPDDENAIRERVARKLGMSSDELPPISLRKRSLDARGGRVRLRLVFALEEPKPRPLLGLPLPREVSGDPPVVVIGAGPAGLFCAYELARHGVRSVVVDRGKTVQPRRRDLALINKKGEVPPDSNYCFGEGGAGTYSDGKLYTRSDKRGEVRDVLETLVVHGAPDQILTDARPHIGSNLLPKVVTALRQRLEGVGVELRFEARVAGLIVAGNGSSRRVTGIRLTSGDEIAASAAVIATGHSARDVYQMLVENDVCVERKGFALGVRIEHPQPLIDGIQYGGQAGHPRLPPAAYKLAATIEGRGVFSFCMCPGGWIVPAATEPDGVVVNGMSLSKRDSPYANSGLVVAIENEDLSRAGYKGVLAGVDFQRAIERAAFNAGGGALRAPATRAVDFLRGTGSSTVPDASYRPGLVASDVDTVLDAGGIALSDRIRAALRRFDRTMRGYASDAVLVGVESRTSSPVRVVRDKETLESTTLVGLFPCGEGAGYAGGIVSAALDGIRIARRIAATSRGG